MSASACSRTSHVLSGLRPSGRQARRLGRAELSADRIDEIESEWDDPRSGLALAMDRGILRRESVGNRSTDSAPSSSHECGSPFEEHSFDAKGRERSKPGVILVLVSAATPKSHRQHAYWTGFFVRRPLSTSEQEGS